MRLIKNIFSCVFLSLALFLSAGHAITYKEVCKDDTLFSSPPKNHFCIKEFEADTQVRMYQAVGLIDLYMRKKLNQFSTVCEKESHRGVYDYYVRCADKYGKYWAEFIFDDTEETDDGEIDTSIFRAICRLNGGEYEWKNICFVKQDVCKNNIIPDLREFGANGEWVPKQKESPLVKQLTRADKGEYCKGNFTKTWTLRNPFEKYGLDNRAFSNFQMQAPADLAILLQRYTEVQLKKYGYTVYSFVCNKSFGKYLTGNLGNPIDDVLSCKANGKWIDFVFDDMSEAQKVLHKGAEQGLSCILDGGAFDGQWCYGLSKERCTELSKDPTFKTKGNVLWDKKLETCKLELFDAKAADDMNKLNQTLAGIGTTVGVAAITIITGGTTAVFLVGTAMSIGGQVVAEEFKKEMTNWTRKFLDVLNTCTNSGCAKNALSNFLADVQTFTTVIDEQISGAVDTIVEKSLEKIKDNNFYQTLLNTLTGPSEKATYLRDGLVAGTALAVLGDVLSMKKGPSLSIIGGKTLKLTRTNAKMITELKKLSNFTSKVSNAYTRYSHTKLFQDLMGGK